MPLCASVGASIVGMTRHSATAKLPDRLPRSKEKRSPVVRRRSPSARHRAPNEELTDESQEACDYCSNPAQSWLDCLAHRVGSPSLSRCRAKYGFYSRLLNPRPLYQVLY